MNLKKRVKEVALANNLDYVGIAPAERLHNELDGIKPTDFLPVAQTVISLGIKLSLGTQLANKMAHSVGPRHLIFAYMWHGFGLPSLHYLDRTAFLITRMLEKEGYIAVPLQSASTFDIRHSLTEFSNLHAAVAAGLGELCWSGLVLTPDAGPRVRWGAVITNAKLEPDPMYQGPKLYDVETCKESGHELPVCATVCPTKAIGSKMEEVIIGDRQFEVANFDCWRCTWASMGLSQNAAGLRDIPMPDKVTIEDIFNGLNKREPSQSTELMVISRGDYCGRCIMECPVGSSKRVDEILSQVRK